MRTLKTQQLVGMDLVLGWDFGGEDASITINDGDVYINGMIIGLHEPQSNHIIRKDFQDEDEYDLMYCVRVHGYDLFFMESLC